MIVILLFCIKLRKNVQWNRNYSCSALDIGENVLKIVKLVKKIALKFKANGSVNIQCKQAICDYENVIIEHEDDLGQKHRSHAVTRPDYHPYTTKQSDIHKNTHTYDPKCVCVYNEDRCVCDTRQNNTTHNQCGIKKKIFTFALLRVTFMQLKSSCSLCAQQETIDQPSTASIRM